MSREKSTPAQRKGKEGRKGEDEDQQRKARASGEGKKDVIIQVHNTTLGKEKVGME
jgi:hypothetical protein